jgi:hypothetical protein
MSELLEGRAVTWSRPSARGVDRWAKQKAVRAYCSQVGLLNFSPGVGSRLDRMLWHEIVHGGEAVAWLIGRTA